MSATIIIIGDEILSGTVADSNSGYIAGELRNIGISTHKIITMRDEVEDIRKALSDAHLAADLIITTGGLGPTKDDRTKTAFQSFFNQNLRDDAATLHHLENLLRERGRLHLLDINRGQAAVLAGAEIFQNDYGTAPCQMIEQNGKITLCLPGVPFEMKPLLKDKIIPFLKEKFQRETIATRTVTVVDFPESLLASTIAPWELALPKDMALSYLPAGNRIRLRLTGKGKDEAQLSRQLAAQLDALKPLLGRRAIAWQGEEVQEILKEILLNQNLSISVAESCTGGEISRLITGVPGSSGYFQGGITAYSVLQKINILNISPETIRHETVVSAAVAREMSLGCQKLFRTDVAVATTGAAGPGSDEFGTETGTVFYSVRIGGSEHTERLFLPHLGRADFMNFVAQRVLQDVITFLVDGFPERFPDFIKL